MKPAEPLPRVRFSELLDAFEFVSVDSPYEQADRAPQIFSWTPPDVLRNLLPCGSADNIFLKKSLREFVRGSGVILR